MISYRMIRCYLNPLKPPPIDALAMLPFTYITSKPSALFRRSCLWLPFRPSLFAFPFPVCLCSFFLSTYEPILTVLAIWVKWWAASNDEAPNQKLGYYLGIYGLLGAGALISLVVSCWSVACFFILLHGHQAYHICYRQLIITMVPRSGERFHSALLRTVLR
jgi:hypothetical protein